MDGASSTTSDLSVSSWGYADAQGQHLVESRLEQRAFRTWSVTRSTGRIAILMLPLDIGAVEALVIAQAMVDSPCWAEPDHG